MLNDVVGEIDVRSVFDERETGFASARVAPEKNVLLKLGDIAGTPIICLLHDGLEVRIERRHEALLAPGACGLLHAHPEPGNGSRCQTIRHGHVSMNIVSTLGTPGTCGR